MREPIEKWQDEFDYLLGFPIRNLTSSTYANPGTNEQWVRFLKLKRSQPVVELPKHDVIETSFNYGDFVSNQNVYDAEEIHAALTAAGIKYTVKE